uniref:SAM domain-containing protein n=1 Tax=Seriola dumerili TaxID=41447 RepID=A0A3B4TAL5_SERDU
MKEVTLWPSISHPPDQEFAESLLNSGVHGAVMVLDPTFNTDTMATALGIPSSKQMVRRHLVEEMKTLIGTARTDAKQDNERLGLGTPPTLLRQNSLGRPPSSTGRHTDDEGSLRRRAVKPPTGFSPKARSGRDLSCHSSYGSLPREVRDQTPPRAEGSPIRGYTSIEVTNV